MFLFIGSVLCYFAAKNGTPETASETLEQMTLWRFVTGLGMGGITPLATTLISEWTSARVRSVVVALVISSVPVGGSLAGLANNHLHWHQMFLVGGLVPLGAVHPVRLGCCRSRPSTWRSGRRCMRSSRGR